VDLQAIGTVAALILLGGWTGIKEYREYRARKHEARMTEELGLSANPERCQDHESRLREVERSCGEIKTDVAVVRTLVGAMATDISDIWKRVNGK